MSEQQLIQLLQAEFATEPVKLYWGIPYFWAIPWLSIAGMFLVMNLKIPDNVGAILALVLISITVLVPIAGAINYAKTWDKYSSDEVLFKRTIPIIASIATSKRGYVVCRNNPSFEHEYNSIANPEATVTSKKGNDVITYRMEKLEVKFYDKFEFDRVAKVLLSAGFKPITEKEQP